MNQKIGGINIDGSCTVVTTYIYTYIIYIYSNMSEDGTSCHQWQGYYLTHWCRVMHICVGKLTIIGSDNGWSPGRCQYHYLNQCCNIVQGVQPWALTKFPDFSQIFPWPFCGFPWPWDILSAFHYCLNTNFASNLTNHSPKVAITK